MFRVVFLYILLIIICLPSQALAQQKVPILVYHSIDKYSGQGGSKELYVTPENFEKQMLYLKSQGYTLLTFEKWDDQNKVDKPIFITLDDGYKNNMNVYKIFKKIKNESFLPSATFFVISDFIGQTNRLSESELKLLSSSGMISVQSHSATHPDLTKTNNLTHELKNSKEKIEIITGKPVIALAYPYGNFNEHVALETKKYYLFGLTTTPELFAKQGLKNELFYLPRIYVKYSTSLEDFSKLITGGQ